MKTPVLFQLLLLACLSASPCVAVTIEATGTVTGLRFFGADGGPFITEFAAGDRRLENWSGAALLSQTASVDLELREARGGWAMVDRSECRGFLTLFCSGLGVAQVQDGAMVLPIHSAASNLQFRLTATEYSYADDTRHAWSNMTGVYDFRDGFSMVVAIDSFVPAPTAPVPLPAPGVMLGTCLAAGVALARRRRLSRPD
ncbi:hypothetical protein [Tropicimonas sediminicola]|uniref:hypothetical protein n=1 Tax=Tropicimonas sediminicola TaxID=1031541 RepID=UPI00159509B8|nr:hypothetical protein [Tropicimonas sediminicola]